MLNQRASKISMDNRSILFLLRQRLRQQRYATNWILGFLSLLSICLNPDRLVAQTSSKLKNPTTYEDDRIQISVRACNRVQQDLICQAVLTSKNSDLTVDLDGNNIKLVDFEGNEYYPSSLKLANRTSENNLIRTELVENVPFKASFIFAKIPTSVTKIALLQIPVGGAIETTAKFRNLVAMAPKRSKSVDIRTPAPRTFKINAEVDSENRLVCPDRTKILYRATTKHYSLYICGVKNPTHYVGLAKDGSQGITLRLRYYDRTRFSADNGETNYTIAADSLTIRQDNKIIYQEKIKVLQALPKTTLAEVPDPKTNPKKHSLPTSTNTIKTGLSTNQTSHKKRHKPIGELTNRDK